MPVQDYRLGVTTGGGTTPNLDLSNVRSFEVIAKGSGNNLIPTSLFVDNINDEVLAENSLSVPNFSLNIGRSVQLGEFGSLPDYTSRVSGRRYLFPIQRYTRTNGTFNMEFFKTLGAEQTFDIQTTFDTVITAPSTITLASTDQRFINAFIINSATSNRIALRFSNSSGDIVKYLPNEKAWNEAGRNNYTDLYSLVDGENTINIEESPLITSTAKNDVAPFRPQIDYTITIRSESTVQLRGNSSDEIFLRLIGHRWELVTVATTDDLNYQSPVITVFNIEGQSSTVDPTTITGGTKNFNITVTNPANVSGDIEIFMNNSSLGIVSPFLSSVALTVPEITLTAGQSVTFSARGTNTRGVSIRKDFVIRARQPQETLYQGVLADVVPANIDETTLTSDLVSSGTTLDIDFVIPNTQYAVMLVPANLDITSIIERTFNQEILSSFTKTEDAKIIGGLQYDLYTHQNNSNVQGTLAVTIRI